VRRATLLLTSLSLLAMPLTGSLAAGSADAVTTAASAACRAPVVDPNDAVGQPLLDNVRVGRHDSGGFDRVVFDLTDVPGYQVHHVRRVIEDGSGLPIRLRGQAFLTVRLEPAVAHNDRGQPTAPGRIVRSFTQLKEVRLAGDFEGVVTYGIGLAARSDFRVFSLTRPDRLVVDLAFPNRHPFDCRSGAVKAYFATPDATTAAVTRRVPTPAVGRGALTALFAGPTDFDTPAGLIFVNSDASGFTGLSIRNGIARVRLTGGCASGGSTFTIANEIMPTLKQFPTVDFVKIFDPQGPTEQPTGRVDSIPTCLEP
jgi:CTP:molybdopterin cytidylyltransferase MocA